MRKSRDMKFFIAWNQKWALIILWVLLAMISTDLYAEALRTYFVDQTQIASLLLWIGWLLTLIGLLVPRTTSLTIIRLLIPVTVPFSIWSVFVTHHFTLLDACIVSISCVATLLSFASFTGDRFVNGSSYGAERRLALFPPASLLLGPLQLTWVVAIIGLCIGPISLLRSCWITGILGFILGWPIAYIAIRAMHGLSKRWIVFVPTGLVIHDLYSLIDPILIQQKDIDNIHFAIADERSVDLTQGAFGRALQIDTKEPFFYTENVKKNKKKSASYETAETSSVRIRPSRISDVLEQARTKNIPSYPYPN